MLGAHVDSVRIMVAFPQITRPIVSAPMAGGPSTPELAAAVSREGGLGMLAAGYLSADVMDKQLQLARTLADDRPLGVNLFVPRRVNLAEDPLSQDERLQRRDQVERYAAQLMKLGYPVTDLEALDVSDDDDWDAKVGALLEARPELVSFTFGCPPRAVIDMFHALGISTAVTVTDEVEAARAVSVGAGALIAQGVAAGGHRGTHKEAKHPNSWTTAEVVGAVRRIAPTHVVIAAGGIARRRDVRSHLEAGADAVQIGTALLLSEEAGTHPVHRAALESERFTETALTRAFSGRVARSLVNDFTERVMNAPVAYPEVNVLTGPMKAAARASRDPESLHLWAGTEWRRARAEPAAEVIRRLDPGRIH